MCPFIKEYLISEQNISFNNTWSTKRRPGMIEALFDNAVFG